MRTHCAKAQYNGACHKTKRVLNPYLNHSCYKTRKSTSKRGFAHASAGVLRAPTTIGQLDWLWFMHRRTHRAEIERTALFRLNDDYGYNQALSRSLHKVNDLLLIARLTATGSGELSFRGATADHVFVEKSISAKMR